MSLLFLDRARLEHALRIGAEDAGREVSGRDEASEQAIAVEISSEARDAAAAGDIAAFPVGAGAGIEMWRDEVVIKLDVATVVCGAEEAIERRVVRQVPGGGELQFQQCNVRLVEIDGVDLRRIGGEVAHHIATTRSDRDDAALAREFERFHVSARVFPNLRVDHRSEGEGERSFEKTCRAERMVLVHRLAQQVDAGRLQDFGCDIHSCSLRSLSAFYGRRNDLTQLR